MKKKTLEENKKKLNIYKIWQDERKRVLGKIEDRELIEKIITKQLLIWEDDIKKQKDTEHFFTLDFFKNNELVQKYFKVFTAISDRNTGKSTYFMEQIKKGWEEKEDKFVIFRTTDIEVEKFIRNSQNSGWLFRNKWFGKSSTGEIYDEDKNHCGNVIPLKTAYKQKSIEFGKVKTIFFDEFISEKNIQDLTWKMISTIITITRNVDAKIYLAANFGDETYPIFEFLNYNQNKKLSFNWIAQSITWNVDRDLFNTYNNRNTVGYNLSLASFEVFKNQYAGQFIQPNKLNLIKEKNIDDLLHIFIWHFDRIKIVLDYDPTTDTYIFREYLTGYDDDKKNIITHSLKVKLHEDHNAAVVNEEFFSGIIEQWLQNKVLCLSSNIRTIVVNQLAQFLRKQKLTPK